MARTGCRKPKGRELPVGEGANMVKKSAVGIAFFLALWGCGLCHAEELPMFLDGNPRYPLVSGINPHRYYLDLGSCAVISGDADTFEIYAEGIYRSSDVAVQHKNPVYRYRQNAESDGKLQYWDGSSHAWKDFPDPYDQDAIEEALDEAGQVDFHFPAYYIFKRVYQHLFGKSYEDEADDDVLRRSALIPQTKETSRICRYLRDDKNYPLVWISQEWAWYLDKSSIYVETEGPPQYILRVLVLATTFLRYDDSLPRSIHSYRFRYDEDEGKMYEWSPQAEEWRCLPPDSNDTSLNDGIKYIGEAAFYHAYGKKFYDVSPRWIRKRNPYFNEQDKQFYERLDGETE